MGQKLNTQEFIKRAKLIHQNKFDYSKVDYSYYQSKIEIICKNCGQSFTQTPNNHLNGKGCPHCSHKSTPKTTEEFINELITIYGNKYDYSKIVYKNRNTKVCIICPKHGEFWRTPSSLLKNMICPHCFKDDNIKLHSKTHKQFLIEAKNIHGDKYEYLSTYINAKTHMLIKCKKCNHIFKQTPHKHINAKHGCPICCMSKAECEIENLLNENNIIYEHQKKFDWLGRQSLDFYLPQYNIAIECQGKQHFEACDFFGGEIEFRKLQNRDIVKKHLCDENNVRLLYFSNLKKIKSDYFVFNNIEELLYEIKSV